jgi:predicted nucleic acid-binding protein
MLLLIAKITGNKDIVVDTNVLVAQVDNHDKWHAQAQKTGSKLKALGYASVYLDCVMNESVGVLARRTVEQKRPSDFLPTLSALQLKVPDDAITWVSKETERLYNDIINLIRQTDGKLNFHDALIALCCQELGIQFIFSFDRDFDDVDWLTRIAEEGDIP